MGNNMNNIMVDIETFGNKSNSVIISIAMAYFNIKTGEVGSTLELYLDIKEQLDKGLTVNADTLLWWLGQDKEAQVSILIGQENKINIPFSIGVMEQFIIKDSLIWGNSNRFDLGLLDNLFTKFNTSIPWNFWNERDVRTLVGFAPNIKKEMEFVGTPHNALDDVKHQIKYCSAIYNKIMQNK